MWVLKLQLKHDCIIGNRCKRFQCTSTGYPLESYKEKGFFYNHHVEQIEGSPEKMKSFINDLKKNKQVTQIENHSNIVFFTYKTKEESTMPAQLSLSAKRVFHVKPVFVDKEGREHWEVAAWRKEELINFIQYLKKKTKGLEEIKILKVIKTKLDTLFFPRVMPQLTLLQKKALDLAINEGYYDYPRNVELEQLAKRMKISLSTYREHLRKAEKAVLPKMQTDVLKG